MKKSQILALDFIIAIFIIIGLMIYIYWAWNFTIIKQQDYRETSELTLMTTQVSENLISNEGSPRNWHEKSSLDNVSAIGFSGGKQIDFDKFSSISGFTYSDFKKKAGVLGSGYELGIKLYTFDGSNYNLNSTYGQFNANKSILIQRHVLMDDEFARFDIFVGAK